MSLHKIPKELQELKQWVLWRMVQRANPETREIRSAKLPVRPTGQAAETTNPEHWVTYDEAVKALYTDKYHRFSGIGFVFTKASGFVGVDLDKCRDKATGVTEEWAREIIRKLASYTELSQSQTGWHIIVKGVLPGGGNRKGRVEMYDDMRYFCMTGERANGMPVFVEERSDVLAELQSKLATLDPGTGDVKPSAPKERAPGTPLGQSEQDFKLIVLLLRKHHNDKGGIDPTVIEAEIERMDPDRYHARQEYKGNRVGQGWWAYNINRILKQNNYLAGLQMKEQTVVARTGEESGN